MDYSLYTDLYQLTMAQGYFLENRHNVQASFSMYFRKLPFGGGYAIFCGSDTLLDIIEHFKFEVDDLQYLQSIQDASGNPVFCKDFLDYLRNLELSINILCPEEGELVFPFEPILRVDGNMLECQLLETAILNCINFQTLSATKALRISMAARGRGVSEFGLRRAQGLGSLWSARASYIGGFSSTSNVLAAKLYDIPVSGTHAHSWVMSHDTEIEAFRSYAELFPTNCTLLVDTYNVYEGVKNAITVAHEMEERGQKLSAIRIDSGDLTWESRRARKMLDDAGLDYVKIVLSNNLDEYTIASLLEEGACVDAFGVGTKYACCMDQATLGGVYKMNAIQDSQGTWRGCMKISESPEKTTVPGVLNVMRFFDKAGFLAGDMVYDEIRGVESNEIIDPMNQLKAKNLKNFRSTKLLNPIVTKGQCNNREPILQVRKRVQEKATNLDYTHKRTLFPHIYPVGVEKELSKERNRRISESR